MNTSGARKRIDTQGGFFVLFLVLLALVSAPAGAGTVTLSPAVVPLEGARGQGITWTLTVRNDTDAPLRFALAAEDVVVEDGERVFRHAGDIAGSIAATAVFSPAQVEVAPGGSASAEVTLTIPANATHRAVVVFFRSTEPARSEGISAMVGLGTLFTFSLGERIALTDAGLEVAPPSASSHARIASTLVNSGAEPLQLTGIAAILDEAGRLVGKVPFPRTRLLPGESARLEAEYGGQLPPGSYRVHATFDHGTGTLSAQGRLEAG